MNRLIVAAAVTSLAVSGTAAEAAKKPRKPSPRAHVWAATLAPSAETSPYGKVAGRAQVVDNKRSDSAKIQIKGALQPGARYDWTVFRVKGTGAACDPANGGETISAFRYKVLRVNASGNASATAKSRTFRGLLDRRYAVAVSDADGVRVACGELKRKKAPAKKKPSAKRRG